MVKGNCEASGLSRFVTLLDSPQRQVIVSLDSGDKEKKPEGLGTKK